MATDAMTLHVSARSETGKSAAKRIRRNGQVPCVIYGTGKDPLKLAAESVQLLKIVNSPGLVNLDIADLGERSVLVREVQRHYLNGNLLHVDFLEVRLDEKITVSVPVEYFGEAIGLQQGGVMDQQFHELEVSCLPTDVPEKIVVDVSALEIDMSITISQIALPANVEFVAADLDRNVFAVTMPKEIEEEEEEEEEEGVVPGEGEAGEGDEPEVIAKGKQEEGRGKEAE